MWPWLALPVGPARRTGARDLGPERGYSLPCISMRRHNISCRLLVGWISRWAANPLRRSGLCRMLHVHFGEYPFHALR